MHLHGLEELLAPFDAQRFRDEFLERQPLFVQRTDPPVGASMPDLAAIEKLIDFGRLESGVDVLAVKEGEVAPGELDAPRVRELMGRGYTIVVTRVDSRFPAVAALCRGIEIDLACDVRANLYMTPPGAVGAAFHYDLHDVVLLQLVGAKAWKVHAPQLELPLESQHGEVDEAALGEPLVDATMRRGDLLYMPRGTIHAGKAEGLSVHVTVGLHFYRWANLLADAVNEAAKRDVALRGAVPRDGADKTEAVRTMLRELADATDAASLLALEDRARLERMPALVGGWLEQDPEQIASDSALTRRPGLPCIVEGAALHWPAGGGMRGPPSIAPALRFIADADGPFRPADLPGNLSENSKVMVCRRLMRDGLLTFDRE